VAEQVASAKTVWSATAATLGAVLSASTALKATLAGLPLASVAVRVTTVLPVPDSGLPGAGLCVTTGAASQASVTVLRPRKSGNSAAQAASA
jgi:hypothetical protein